MPRTASSIKKLDVERAVLGAQAAGINVARIEIDPKSGRIIIVAGNASAEPVTNDLDAELAAFEARHEGKT